MYSKRGYSGIRFYIQNGKEKNEKKKNEKKKNEKKKRKKQKKKTFKNTGKTKTCFMLLFTTISTV